MIFHFAETARIVASHVAEGRRVRLVGSAGSGRSTTLRQIARMLEARGIEVLRTPDVARQPQLPGFAVAALQLGSKEDRRSSMDLAVSTQRALLQSPGSVLLIDDSDRIDAVSAEILDSVSPPLGCVRVMRPGVMRSEPVWPELTVAMPELGFDEVAELLHERLQNGHPSAALTARILSNSGGNPELVIAIAESALLSGLLLRERGSWRLAGLSLWNEHLAPLMRWRIQELDGNERRLLRSVAVHGPAALAALDREGEDTLATLIARDVVRVAAVAPTERLVEVWPPLLGELLRRETAGSVSSGVRPGGSAVQLLPASTTARIFEAVVDEEADERFRQWRRSPTTAAANAYLIRIGDTALDRERAREVFAATSHTTATREGAFRFAFLRAQWLAFECGDLDAALAVLSELARTNRRDRVRSRAAELLLRVSLEAVPAGYADELAEEGGNDETGFANLVLATLHFFSGELARSTAILSAIPDRPEGITAPALLSSLLQAYSGDLRGAHTEALARRVIAVRERDRIGYVAGSYVAVVTAFLEGRMSVAQQLVGSALGLAPITLIARPIYGAMLNLASGIARVSHRGSVASLAFAKDVANYAPFAGPLYATGTDLTPHVTMGPDDRRSFDHLLAEGVRLRCARGYLTSAWTTAICGVIFDTGDELVEQIEYLSRVAPIPLFENAAHAASAVRHRRIDDVRAMLMSERVGQDVHLVAQVLRAGQRRAIIDGHSDFAEELEPFCRTLEALSLSPMAPLAAALDTTERLSVREREVAYLAATMTNAQIAAHLNISVRTVEHHISNGLRKTGRPTRAELASAVLEED